ncbi:MAG: HlyD family secretion protein [Arenicella sp.]|jgi:HlyD family secretion protein
MYLYSYDILFGIRRNQRSIIFMHSKQKKILRILLAGSIVIVIAFFASERLNHQSRTLPSSFVQANGRIEAEQIDISSKITGRVSSVLAEEGDLVSANQVLAILDTNQLNASLATVDAELARAQEAVLEGKAQLQQSINRLGLANTELRRIEPLVESGGVSRRDYDQRENEAQNALAAKNASLAHVHTLEKSTLAAKAQVNLIQSQIDDCTLIAPTRGRVLYRLAENFEVVAAGAPLLTIVDLSNIYMEVYLSASSAARLAIGAQARIKLDFLPEYTIPAKVVFVSPEAQFTPKQVETKSDRENLMFRVKLRVPRELVEQHIERVKTGVRGDAYVRIDELEEWPVWLAIRLPKIKQTPS